MSDLNPFKEPQFWYAIISVFILGVTIGAIIMAFT
jgi:uncharacterized membrane-anchored protein YhcB (DUF1043 family)